MLLITAGVFCGAAEKPVLLSDYSKWRDPVRINIKREKTHVKLSVKGGDSFFTIRDLDIDAQTYDTIEFEYRAKGIPAQNAGQLYFAGAGQSFGPQRYFVLQNLRPDWQWHTVTLTTPRHGRNSWTGVGKVNRLRLDITDCKSGEFEIRNFRLISRKSEECIVPGEDDFADVSVKHLHVARMGKKHKNPFWIGKSNRFDHRHRGLFRFPLEKLIPRGEVKKAVLELRLLWYSGPVYEREYAVLLLKSDIQKLKALDVRADAVEIGRVKMGKYSSCETVKLDVTQKINEVLSRVQTGLTLRIQPVPEENLDPGPSGAVVNLDSVRLVIE